MKMHVDIDSDEHGTFVRLERAFDDATTAVEISSATIVEYAVSLIENAKYFGRRHL